MKKMKLKKGWLYLLAFINILILMSVTNNDILVDLILMVVFSINCKILLKYGGLDEC